MCEIIAAHDVSTRLLAVDFEVRLWYIAARETGCTVKDIVRIFLLMKRVSRKMSTVVRTAEMCRRMWGPRSVKSRGGSIGQEGAPQNATPHRRVYLDRGARE